MGQFDQGLFVYRSFHRVILEGTADRLPFRIKTGFRKQAGGAVDLLIGRFEVVIHRLFHLLHIGFGDIPLGH